MGNAALVLVGLFVVGFVAGMYLNHPDELPPQRLRGILLGGWVAWTALFAAIAAFVQTKLCPPAACLGAAVWLAWASIVVLWAIGGAAITAGLYAARSYLRTHG